MVLAENSSPRVMGPPTPDAVSHWRTCRTQHLVVLTVTIYYSEGTQSTMSNGKGVWGEVQEKPDASFQEATPWWEGVGHTGCT